jgi:hypothetical protein
MRFLVTIQSSVFIEDDSVYTVENYEESQGIQFDNKGEESLYIAE